MKIRPLLLAAAMVPALIRAQNVGYVVDNAHGQVAVLDLGTRQVRSLVPVGTEPSELLVLPDNRWAFVSVQGENKVALLDLRGEAQVVGFIGTGQIPGSVIATSDGRRLYVAAEGSNDVTVIDVAGRKALATIQVDDTPVQVNLSPDERYLYVVVRPAAGAGSVAVIDTNRNTLLKTLAVGDQPTQFALSPNRGTAYVVNSGSDSVSVVDLARNEVTGTIGVGRGPSSVAFSTDGRRLYVLNRGGNSISVIDTAGGAVVAQIPTGAQPAAMAVTFDSAYGYVTNQGSGTVSILDLARNTNEGDVTTGNGPFSLMLDPNENYLYVTCLGSGTVTVIDVNTDRVAGTVALGGGSAPVQFTMLNSPTLLEAAPNPAAAGSLVALGGEGFLPTSRVRFVPGGTVTPEFIDSRGLRASVPASVSGPATVWVVQEDGNESERVSLAQGISAQAVFAGGVVEGAGFTRAPAPISGDAIVSVFGNFPGMTRQEAAAFPLPSTLGGAKVTFNGLPAPLLGTYPNPGMNQINVVAPVRLLSMEGVRVAVTVGGQTSAAEPVNVAVTSPGIFIREDGLGAFLHQPDPATGETPAVRIDNPARKGEILSLFVTGLGDTTPPPMDGEPAPRMESRTTLAVKVTVAGIDVVPQYSGLAPDYSGLYQINFQVPQSAPSGNELEVTVTAGGRTSNKSKLAVR